MIDESFRTRINDAKKKYQDKSTQKESERKKWREEFDKEREEYATFMTDVVLSSLENIQKDLESNDHKCDLHNGLPQGGISLEICPNLLNTDNNFVEISFFRGSTNDRLTITGIPKSVKFGSFRKDEMLFHDDELRTDITSKKIEENVTRLLENAYDIWD